MDASATLLERESSGESSGSETDEGGESLHGQIKKRWRKEKRRSRKN